LCAQCFIVIQVEFGKICAGVISAVILKLIFFNYGIILRRWVDNIKMDLREIGWDGVDWIDMAQNRDQYEDSCEHGIEPSCSIKFWGVLEGLSIVQPLKKGSAP
jgi:hypothetical protein